DYLKTVAERFEHRPRLPSICRLPSDTEPTAGEVRAGPAPNAGLSASTPPLAWAARPVARGREERSRTPGFWPCPDDPGRLVALSANRAPARVGPGCRENIASPSANRLHPTKGSYPRTC